MSTTGRRPRRTIAEINVVPYIDVMLVLLIIFMVTAPFVNPALIDLPTVAKANTSPKTPPVEIVVKADGALAVRKGGDKRETVVSRAQLVDEVRRRLTGDADTPVVISADKAVRYENVTDVMSDLQTAGLRRIGLAVKPSGAGNAK